MTPRQVDPINNIPDRAAGRLEPRHPHDGLIVRNDSFDILPNRRVESSSCFQRHVHPSKSILEMQEKYCDR